MTSPLEALSGPGKSLRQEPPDAREFAGLQRSGHARLLDAARTEVSLEGRFDVGRFRYTKLNEAMRWMLTARRRIIAGICSRNRTGTFRCQPTTDITKLCGRATPRRCGTAFSPRPGEFSDYLSSIGGCVRGV
jgi:hypothetical protein